MKSLSYLFLTFFVIFVSLSFAASEDDDFELPKPEDVIPIRRFEDNSFSSMVGSFMKNIFNRQEDNVTADIALQPIAEDPRTPEKKQSLGEGETVVYKKKAIVYKVPIEMNDKKKKTSRFSLFNAEDGELPENDEEDVPVADDNFIPFVARQVNTPEISPTPSNTPSATASTTVTLSPGSTQSPTPSATVTSTNTRTATVTPSSSITPSVSKSPAVSPSAPPSQSSTPSASITPSTLPTGASPSSSPPPCSCPAVILRKDGRDISAYTIRFFLRSTGRLIFRFRYSLLGLAFLRQQMSTYGNSRFIFTRSLIRYGRQNLKKGQLAFYRFFPFREDKNSVNYIFGYNIDALCYPFRYPLVAAGYVRVCYPVFFFRNGRFRFRRVCARVFRLDFFSFECTQPFGF